MTTGAGIIECLLECTSNQTILRRKNLKTQQSPVTLDLCLRKFRNGESHDYHYVIVL